jgi:hypothetical protein
MRCVECIRVVYKLRGQHYYTLSVIWPDGMHVMLPAM